MKIYFLLVAFALLLGSAACGSASIQAENSTQGAPAPSNAGNSMPANSNAASSQTSAPQISPATIAGSYKREISRAGKKEGYVNYLAIENKGKGKLAVYFNATHISEANGAETVHKTNAGGDLTLRANQASGKITEDDGNGEIDAPCAVTINFAAGQASVKSAAGCGFSAGIDGVYKKEKRKSKSEEEVYLAHVEFDRLAEYINTDIPPPTGEEFVVERVPMINKIGRADESAPAFKGLFWLTADGDSDVNTSFYAASDLVEALRPKLKTEAHHLRVECVLIEVSGAGEAYRSPYAVAVEALDADGKALWRVTGAKPKRVRIQY